MLGPKRVCRDGWCDVQRADAVVQELTCRICLRVATAPMLASCCPSASAFGAVCFGCMYKYLQLDRPPDARVHAPVRRCEPLVQRQGLRPQSAVLQAEQPAAHSLFAPGPTSVTRQDHRSASCAGCARRQRQPPPPHHDGVSLRARRLSALRRPTIPGIACACTFATLTSPSAARAATRTSPSSTGRRTRSSTGATCTARKSPRVSDGSCRPTARVVSAFRREPRFGVSALWRERLGVSARASAGRCGCKSFGVHILHLTTRHSARTRAPAHAQSPRARLVPGVGRVGVL